MNPLTEFVVFGFTVADVLSEPRFTSQARNLTCVELWSGRRRIATAASKLTGGSTATMDIEDDPVQQDLSTKAGFEYALNLVMRVVVWGLLTMAPVCSSFTFPDTSHTCRNKLNYSGDESYEPVRQGNAMARVAAFLLLLGQQRQLFVLLENPSGSMFFNYVYVKMVVQYLIDVLCNVYTVVTPHCAFTHTVRIGNRFFKPFKLLAIGGKANWIAPVKKRCPCGSAGHQLLMPKNKRGKPTGNEQKLKDSQGYSPAFGKSIVQEWLAARKAMEKGGPQEEGLHFTALTCQLAKEEAMMEAFWVDMLTNYNEHDSGGGGSPAMSITEMSLKNVTETSLEDIFSWKDRSGTAVIEKEEEKEVVSKDNKTHELSTGSNKRARKKNEPLAWKDRASSSTGPSEVLDWRVRLG